MKEEYIEMKTDGHRHLGAAVGWNENKEEFVIAKVSESVKQLDILTNLACTKPHAAFSDFTFMD